MLLIGAIKITKAIFRTAAIIIQTTPKIVFPTCNLLTQTFWFAEYLENANNS